MTSCVTVAVAAVGLQAPPLIVPRFIFELSTQQLLTALESHAAVTDLMVAEVKKQGLDGLVSTCAAVCGTLNDSKADGSPAPRELRTSWRQGVSWIQHTVCVVA